VGFELKPFAKQELYCLSHTAVHFALVILEIGSGWPEPSSFYFRLPDIAGMTGYRQTPPHPAFFH
jgi:hypothetical protein